MALNKYMHPRNVYKDRKPNFKELAEKYEEFRKHVHLDERGKVIIDFKKPECLRALSWALLKDDFGLEVLMPLDRLIPTIPLRLNYILWLEDILSDQTGNVTGIDIGTGASCVYPLLGAKKNTWNFLATESDATNYQYAKKNVENNKLTDNIKVIHVPEGSTLHDILLDSNEKYDFCMCNPPFYGSNFEAWGMLTSRSENRPEPSSISTASPVESIVPGGEVQFAKQMISDSLLLKDRIRIYTTMLGKKSSIPVLKDELKRNGITNLSITEFCQGKTMRWGLGWSFDPNVKFPKPTSKTLKAQKPRPPLVYHIPKQSQLSYTVEDVCQTVLTIFKELQICISDVDQAKKLQRFVISATTNTWSHQRRKRRQQKNQANNSVNVSQSSNSSTSGAEEIKPDEQQSVCLASSEPNSSNDPDELLCSKKSKIADEKEKATADQSAETKEDHVTATEGLMDAFTCNNSGITKMANGAETQTRNCSGSTTSDPDSSFTVEGSHNGSGKSQTPVSLADKGERTPSPEEAILFSATVTISEKSPDDIILELLWLKGESREAMHQVLQYIKNKLQ